MIDEFQKLLKKIAEILENSIYDIIKTYEEAEYQIQGL